jgi:histidine triad (HIT) family protein
MTNCVFCAIIAGTSPATVVRAWDDAIAILPRADQHGRRGCTDGHTLVIPRTHVADAGADPDVTAAVMRRAAELTADAPAANLITSKGAPATQTVFHLHIHIVPRQPGDGLLLPWSPHPTANPELGDNR